MLRSFACGLAAALGCVALISYGLGFGALSVHSSLGQPLDADIPLLSVPPGTAGKVKVSIPSQSVFEHAGVTRPAYVDNIHVDVVKGKGHDRIRLTTKKAFRSPYLDLLLQVQSPQGRVVREFTALINPPGMQGTQAAANNPAAATSSQSTSHGQASSAHTSQRGRLPTRYGPVKRNESLWLIAKKLRPAHGVTQDQMIMGIFKNNPKAFDGNINSLHAGAMLTVPSKAEIASINRSHAYHSVKRQLQAFRHKGKVHQAGQTHTASSAGSGSSHGRLELVATGGAANSAGGSAQSGGRAQPGAGLGPGSGVIHISDKVLASLEQKAQQNTGNPFQAEPLPSSVAAGLGQGADSQMQTAASGAGGTTAATMQTAPEGSGENESAPGTSAALESQAATPEESAKTAKTSATGSGPQTAASSSNKPQAGASASQHGAQTAQNSAASQSTAASGPGKASSTAASARSQRGTGMFDGASGWITVAQGWLHNRLLLGLILLLLLLLFISLRRRQRVKSARRGADVGAAGGEPRSSRAAQDLAGGASAAAFGSALADATDAASERPPARAYDSEPVVSDEPVGATPTTPEDAQAGAASVEDAIADADFNMAYGLYDEALTELRDPKLGYPKDRALRVKELEVLFAAKRGGDFLDRARLLQPELDDDPATWQRIAQMGHQLLPDEPLFAPEHPTGATARDADSQSPPVAQEEPGQQPPHEAETASSPSDPTPEPIPLPEDGTEPQVSADLTDAASDRATSTSEPQEPAGDQAPQMGAEDAAHFVDFDFDEPFRPGSQSDRQAGDELDIPGVDFNVEDLRTHAGAPEQNQTPEGEAPKADSASAEDFSDEDWTAYLADASGPWQPESPVEGGSAPTSGTEENQPSPPAEEPESGPVFDTVDGAGASNAEDDIEIKLDLARAYVEMGDRDMARGLIDEVLKQGNEAQRHEAEALQEQLK